MPSLPTNEIVFDELSPKGEELLGQKFDRIAVCALVSQENICDRADHKHVGEKPVLHWRLQMVKDNDNFKKESPGTQSPEISLVWDTVINEEKECVEVRCVLFYTRFAVYIRARLIIQQCPRSPIRNFAT